MKLDLYGKADCSLCEKMQATLAQVGKVMPFELEKHSIEDEPEAWQQYWKDIPVLLHEGRILFRHRVTEAALRQALLELVAERS